MVVNIDNNPMVSIIMPCHNGEKFIRQSIQSVLDQTYSNWELLVVEDKSSDLSVNIVKEYCEKDCRVKLLYNDRNTGRPASPRNYGIEHATGAYLAFLDCDDTWKNSHLTNLLKLFDDERVIAAFSWYNRIDENGNCLGTVKTPQTLNYHHLFYDNFIGNLTGMYDLKKRGKVFQHESGHEDYTMWLEVLKEGGIARSTNTIEAFYRETQQSVSSNKFKACAWRWNILRKEVGLPVLVSAYYLLASFFFIYLKKSKFSYLLPKLIKA